MTFSNAVSSSQLESLFSLKRSKREIGALSLTARTSIGTRPDYLANRADQKNQGRSGKKIAQKSRNSCRLSGGVVGEYGQLTQGPNFPSPGTKYKRSKNIFAVTSIAHTLVPLIPKLLVISAQFLIGSTGTLVRTPLESLFEFLVFLGYHVPQ